VRDDIHIRDRTFERKYSLVLTILQVIQSVVEVVAVAYLGGGGRWCDRPLWFNREFLDNFCAVIVSFILRLKRKIRVLHEASIPTVRQFVFSVC